MEHIARNIANIERNIEIVGADPVTLHGFTMVPNVVLTNSKLSVGAKLAYAMVLKYAWNNNYCFPGQLRLAKDMGAGERSVRTYLKELEATGLLEIQQRGLGRTNFYRLFATVDKTAGRRRRPAKFAGQDRQ
jgi:Helix-turn-helix domain